MGLLGWGGVVLGGLVVREKVAREPILPLELFRMQIFTVANIVSFVSGVAMFAALAFLPQYLQLVHGASATESGLLLLRLLIVLLLFCIGSRRHDFRPPRAHHFPLRAL